MKPKNNKIHLSLNILWMLLITLISTNTQAIVPQIERDALVALYNSTGGANWTDNSNWLVGDPCDNGWFGVTCINQSITEVNLTNGLFSGNNLVGFIPSEIGDLSNLKNLNLKNGQLSGNIPITLAGLNNLEIIDLRTNQLTGNIPIELGALSNLKKLILSTNQLTGFIPVELSNLSNLEVLILNSNQLTGTIPIEIANLTNLNTLMLRNNQLIGGIPVELGSMLNIQTIWLNANQLTGTIPIELGNLTNLKSLFLDYNLLTGNIPSELGGISSLEQFWSSSNQHSGSIPLELGNLTNLKSLDLSGNQLTGSIPKELGNLINLRSLRLSSNLITGGIPPEIGNLINLTELRLESNDLNLILPIEVGNLTSLRVLNLNRNRITSNIPIEIGNLTSLTTLNLGTNLFNGTIPSELGNLSSLTILNLEQNHFSGLIPQELGNLTSLQQLLLSKNELIGNIPNSLINLTNILIGNLSLNYNGLYTNNTTLDAFLDSKQGGGDWSITQTIAPANLVIANTTAFTISLTWDLIEYTQNPGRYRIWYSESPTGPYLDGGGATNSKTENSFTLTGLTENKNYYIVVRTESDAGSVNQNMIISDNSNQVMATTLQNTQSSIVTGQITAWQESSGAITVGDGINHVTFYWSIASANSGWFYGSSTSLNPDSDVAFLDGVTDINQVGDISNILFNGGSIGTFCDIDCDPDGVGDFMIGINVNTGHLAVLRIDNIISGQMNATWWFQKNITNFFDSIFSNNFE